LLAAHLLDLAPTFAGTVGAALALFRHERGNAAVEFGMVTPIVAAIFVPSIDVGMGVYQQMQVQDAAQAGAQYAMAHGWNITAIQNAVTGATTLATVSALPAPTLVCGCPGGSSVVSAACGGTCPNGQPVGTYVTVNAEGTYTTLIPYPVLGTSVTLSAQATARIR